MLKLFITQSSLSFPCFLTSFQDFSAFEKKCSNERSKDKIQNQQQKCPNKKNNKEKKGKTQIFFTYNNCNTAFWQRV